MSDSDDTDVLLLIPPDLFLVPSSSDSDISVNSSKRINSTSGRIGVISELVEHMQTLESRISAIESKDNSLDGNLLNSSLDSYNQSILCSRRGHTLPRSKLSVSRALSLQITPVKPCKSSSVPSTPIGYSPSNRTNKSDERVGHYLPMVGDTNTSNTNTHTYNKHDVLTSRSDLSMVPSAFHGQGTLHATDSYPLKESYLSLPNESNFYDKSCDRLHSVPSTSNLHSTVSREDRVNSTSLQNMELSEVNELIQQMEATELQLSKKINGTSYRYLQEQTDSLLCKQGANKRKDSQVHINEQHCEILSSGIYQQGGSNVFPDTFVPNNSFQLGDVQKIALDIKSWEQNICQTIPKNEYKLQCMEVEKSRDISPEINVTKKTDVKGADTGAPQSILSIDEVNKVSTNSPQIPSKPVLGHLEIVPPINEHKKFIITTPIKNSEVLTEAKATSQYTNNLQDGSRNNCEILSFRSTANVSTNTEPHFRPQKLLSLSDFWDVNTNKSQEEIFRIKLEEEKFRREHCEHLIQELQKRLLEQQEKLAVALRLDNEKNVFISQFHNAWSKLKQFIQLLETEHQDMQSNLKNVNEKHQSEITELQSQLKRYEGELSKALDLAAGYKEKSDCMMIERINFLKDHADELENYKSLVQEAEGRYEQMKGEYCKLSEKNQESEETLKTVQLDLNKERCKGGEIRSEMNIIHKALDACEAELTVLRQEKESLQLKLKEEINRNTILEQKNSMLLTSLDDAKIAEKLVKDELKSTEEQKAKIKGELQEVYQQQVDEVVKTKLREFQTQLDAAEVEFLEELKTRQQVIAECAARKIKDVIDKHRLEINLIEEKHKEEKRLCKLQLAQAVQKSSILEMQLKSQHANKSQLAEQLHSVMQKQWQQALYIISGGNLENLTPLQRINAEKLFDNKGPKKSISNSYFKSSQEPMKLASLSSETQMFQDDYSRHSYNENISMVNLMEETPLTSRKGSKEDLRKYIKLIPEMLQSKECRENVSSPTSESREVPRKHYVKRELSIMSEDSASWQPVSEGSTHDCSEYIPVAETVTTKMEQQKSKPPWK